MLALDDMADLICIRDAYKAMNKSLLGEETALVFNEGDLVELGESFRLLKGMYLINGSRMIIVPLRYWIQSRLLRKRERKWC